MKIIYGGVTLQYLNAFEYRILVLLKQQLEWPDYKPVDVEIDDDNTGISLVLELRIGMNEFDQPICIALHRHRRGSGSNSCSGLSRCCLSSANYKM